MYHHRAGCTTNLVNCLQCAHAASCTTHTAVSQSSDSGHLHCRPLCAPLYTTASNCSCLALTTVPTLRTWCCLRYMNVATACMYTVMFSDAITSQLSHPADQHMPRTTLADPMHHMSTHHPGGLPMNHFGIHRDRHRTCNQAMTGLTSDGTANDLPTCCANCCNDPTCMVCQYNPERTQDSCSAPQHGVARLWCRWRVNIQSSFTLPAENTCL